MERITLIGNITADATVKEVGTQKVINYCIAVNEKYKNKNGEKVEKSYFYNCTMWKPKEASTSVANYLTKGTLVHAEGVPEPDVYKNKDGEMVGAIKVNITEVRFLGGGNSNRDNANSSGSNSRQASPIASMHGDNPLGVNHSFPHDDMPF